MSQNSIPLTGEVTIVDLLQTRAHVKVWVDYMVSKQ